VTREQELLRQLQVVLSSADVDVGELVEGAWREAQDEVRATLRRLMSQDLLARALASLDGEEVTPVAPEAPPEPAAAPEPEAPPQRSTEPDPDPPAGRARDAVAPTEEPVAAPEVMSTYLYGIVPATTGLPRTDLPRLPGGGALRLVAGERAGALVCDVDPATFEALRDPGPETLDLLAAAAHAHDGVLARFVDAPVLPLPLGTVVADDGAVHALLDRHADPLTSELERLTGVAEYSVAVRTVEDAPEADTDTATSGRDYLEARRAARSQRENRWADQERLVAEFHGPLAACAVDAVEVPSRPLEDAVPPLLHGVYLVADDARDRFDSTVTYLRGEHPEAIVEVTGPWPPYHFADLDLSGDREPAP
jgi:hypothetical protein